MPRPDFKPAHCCIYGAPGCGKSTLLVDVVLSDPRPAYWIDPLFEHAGRPGDVIERTDDVAVVDAVARRAWDRGNCQVVVDECELLWMDEPPPLSVRYLAHVGRHRNVRLILATQRPTCIPPKIAFSAAELYAFGVQIPADIEYFAKLGLDRDKMALTNGHDFWHRTRDLPIWHKHQAPLTSCHVATEDRTP